MAVDVFNSLMLQLEEFFIPNNWYVYYESEDGKLIRSRESFTKHVAAKHLKVFSRAVFIVNKHTDEKIYKNINERIRLLNQ